MPQREQAPAASTRSPVGVVGAGTMGSGIAQTFATAGFDVVLVDVGAEQLRRGIETIRGSLAKLESKQKLPRPAPEIAGRITTALSDGVGAAEDIDTVMTLGMGHPLGPLRLADLIGLDVCLAILEVLHRDLGDAKYRPSPLLRQYVAAGWLGRKSGRGVYAYT